MNPEVVMRTSVQHEIGGYDSESPHAGDIEMWMRAAAVSDVGRVNGAAQGYYRIHPDSMQRTTYAGHLIDLEGRLAAFEKVLTVSERRVPRSDHLLETARRALAASAIAYARSAYAHGRAGTEPVEEYLAFAAQVWPPVRRTRRWRATCQRAEARTPRLTRRVSATVRRVVEDLQGRVRWRRWRWTGV